MFSISGHSELIVINVSFKSSRFGKKKDEKSKDAVKGSKNKLDVLSEGELDQVPDNRDG